MVATTAVTNGKGAKGALRTRDRADRENEEISAAIAKGAKPTTLTIPPPNIRLITVTIVGTAPYVQNKFSAKAEIMKTQQEGSTAKSRKKREPKDFDKLFQLAQHKSVEGWNGMPAAGFRNAMIEACRLVGYHMTKAKMSIFVVGDGLDDEGTPLIKMKGSPKQVTPKMITKHVRNDSGVIDIRARPMWESWSASISINYDADQFREEDVVNLLNRAGTQVGVGEGRPFSKDSAGMGWGTFKVQ
jgi:hypothetical protein